MNSKWTTKNGRTSRRGLFVEGIWHCDCEPRMPAEKFRVKNGGQNHGRWFYTCQKSQPKRCPFFLWSDDAKVREEAAVLNNSRNEPGVATGAGVGADSETEHDRAPKDWIPEEAINAPKTPRTPMRQSKITQPITPISNTKSLKRTPSPPQSARSNTLSPRSPSKGNNDELFDWSSSADEELVEVAHNLESNNPYRNDAESPRKSVKIAKEDSPNKRKHSGTMDRIDGDSLFGSELGSTWLLTANETPTTPTKNNDSSNIILTPGTTPVHPIRQPQPHTHPPTTSRQPHAFHPSEDDPSPLALEALHILSPLQPTLPQTITQPLITLLNRHDLRAQGILKGREIARTAIQAKEKKITELQARIASLEAERETSRTVIMCLKSDIARSPGKGNAGGGKKRENSIGGSVSAGGFRRSEV